MNSSKWTVPISQQVQQQQSKSWLASLGETIKKFNPCLRPEKQSDTLTKFLSEFKQVSLYDDPYFGEVFLLESLTHNQEILIKKEKLYESELPERQKQIAELQSFKNNLHIISQTLIEKIHKVGFLWSKVQLYLAYDFIVFDLQKEFEYRVAKGTRFAEQQIMSIIKGACKGYIHLQSTEYASVRMNYIYFTRRGFVKIAHPHLFHYKTNLQCICEYDESKGIYLSPQQMVCLENGQKNAILGWKSNSFVFGMVLLSLMSQQHINEVYDYSSCYIDRAKVNQLLRNCKQMYPEKLVYVVEKLIEEKPEQRLTFRNLLNKITNLVQTQNQVDLQLLNQGAKPITVDSNYGQGISPSISQHQYQKQPLYHNYLTQLVYPKVCSTDPVGIVNSRVNYSLDQYEQNILNQQRHFYANKNSRYVGEVRGGDKQVAGELVPYREGKGYYKNHDGQIYVGDWTKGDMSGYGKLYWNQQKLRYEGQFLNGRFNGSGTEYNGDPNIVGCIEVQDEPDHTFVRMQRNNWVKYEGNFKNDKREGQGIVYFKTGKWMGNFKEGQPNGQGIFIANNGSQTRGMWNNGIIQ